MKIENLEDGWVKFRRYYCKEGFIDYWIGNGLDNPNLQTPNQLSLGIKSYFRLNGTGGWKERMWFKENLVGLLNIGCRSSTAEEIWEYTKR